MPTCNSQALSLLPGICIDLDTCFNFNFNFTVVSCVCGVCVSVSVTTKGATLLGKWSMLDF